MLTTVSRDLFIESPDNICPLSKCPPAEWPNVISLESSIGEVSRRSVAPLSIKCSLKGNEIFEVGGSTKIVDAHSYLIVNEWQPYTASILDDQTESLCVFFNDTYSHNVVAALLSSNERMLDNMPADWNRSFDFFEKLYSHDQCVSPALYKVAKAIKFSPCIQDGVQRNAVSLPYQAPAESGYRTAFRHGNAGRGGEPAGRF